MSRYKIVLEYFRKINEDAHCSIYLANMIDDVSCENAYLHLTNPSCTIHTTQKFYEHLGSVMIKNIIRMYNIKNVLNDL